MLGSMVRFEIDATFTLSTHMYIHTTLFPAALYNHSVLHDASDKERVKVKKKVIA